MKSSENDKIHNITQLVPENSTFTAFEYEQIYSLAERHQNQTIKYR